VNLNRNQIIHFVVALVFLAGCRSVGGDVETAVVSTSLPTLLVSTATSLPEVPITDEPVPQPTQKETPTATALPPTPTPLPSAPEFDGANAFTYLEAQMALGPRWPGSPGHLQLRHYIQDTLVQSGWAVTEQSFDYQGFTAVNLIAKANEGQGPVIILGAHYDTRRLADQTPDAGDRPVPGAVDGGSGVAVLLELARTLDLEETNHEVWLAFFDVEDNGHGGLPGWDYIAGSTYMANNLTMNPEAVVVVDMVGQVEQEFYFEGNSNQGLRLILWRIAADLGYGEQFIQEQKYTMIDDHLPFARRGVSAVDIIDFDYAYWHTTEDTLDKVSPASLEQVGRTLEYWLEDYLDN
jgi:hypothetical protein